MQWFSSLLGENWKVQGAVFLAVAIVAIIALVVAYRALFGHRLRVPGGGRARQSRLGLVDAFSLDGQRQLVLVRRDNVEHLVMIGGLNDVVIESQIVRALTQSPAPREKEVAPPQPPVATPRIVASAPSPATAPAAPPPAAASHSPPPAAPAPSPPRPPTRPEPPNIAAQTRSSPKPIETAGSAKPSAATAPPPPPAPVKQSSLPPPIVAAQPPAPGVAAPSKPAASSSSAPNTSPRPAQEPKATPSDIKPESFAGLESLEAEMAKLLGRKS